MAKPRPVAVTTAAPSTSYASAFMPPPSPSDADLLLALHRLARDLSAADTPAPFLRAAFASVSRRARLLAAAFDDLLLSVPDASDLPRSASLCLRELLLVLQRFKAVVADCAARSRTLLLLRSDETAAELRDLHHDLATLLDLLPVVELGLADDVADLLALASRQCRRSSGGAEAAGPPALKAGVLALIDEIEREIVPGRDRLEGVLEEVGVNDPASCGDEIEALEREIGDRASERWTPAMIALVGLLRYAKCVLFSATPRPSSSSDSKPDSDSTDADLEESPAPPMDLRCPISLDLMRDPVVAASGQTYDRESIDRWFNSGKSTCPKTGQVLASLDLVPNKSLKNLITKWCRENGVAMEPCEASKGEQAQATAANKAALEVARMTASFLVKKLSATFSPDAASRVVHEIRLLSKSGSDQRAFVGEAGAVPMLVPLLYSEDAGLQLNAVTALLNLSILEANKKRIMHADGAVEAVAHTMAPAARRGAPGRTRPRPCSAWRRSTRTGAGWAGTRRWWRGWWSWRAPGRRARRRTRWPRCCRWRASGRTSGGWWTPAWPRRRCPPSAARRRPRPCSRRSPSAAARRRSWASRAPWRGSWRRCGAGRSGPGRAPRPRWCFCAGGWARGRWRRSWPCPGWSGRSGS
ncbi:hypothetical protein QYE76_055650 [Lolium multiflorum]|uniref:RING-type E3 ubiquitin transferase n=1 Tax=Lolium multiflorum TaxID=4521 RepID=A0AAD8T1F3_LOLMU|nr:hypothetical protein QYE76_055650 [Lolium multiflorum]